MEKTRIIGYRAHPEFSSLVQTVYECGHAYSTTLHEFRIAGPQEKRCAKCVTGAPADISHGELSRICHQTPADHPLIGRLAAALSYRLGMSEKRQYLDQEARPDLEEAIGEARRLLEEVGYRGEGLDIPAPATAAVVGETAAQTEAGEGPDPAASGIYYFELPDLSLL